MLGRKSLLIFLVNVVGGVTGLVLLAFIGRFMTPGALGIYSFSISVVLAGASVLQSLDSAHVKHYSATGRPGTLLRTFAVLRLASILAYVLVLFAAFSLWHHFVGFTDATFYGGMLLALVFVALLQVRFIPASTFNARLEAARTQMMNVIEHLLRLGIVIPAALVFGYSLGRTVPAQQVVDRVAQALGVSGPLDDQAGALVLISAHAIAVAVSALIGTGYLLRGQEPGGFDRDVAKSYLRFSAPLALTGLLTGVAGNLDKILLGFFASSHSVGLYTAAQRLMLVVVAVPAAVGSLFFPMMSELAARGERAGLTEVSKSVHRQLSRLMVIGAVAIAVFAPEILRIAVGTAFLDAADALVVLAGVALASTHFVLVQNMLMGLGRSGRAAAVAATVTSVTLVLTVALVPGSVLGVPLAGLGMVGAALATLLGLLGGTSLGAVFIRRDLGAWPFSGMAFRHWLAAIPAAAVSLLAAPHVERFYHLLLAGVVVLAVYLGGLVLMREVGRKDLLLLREMLHPGHMLRYLRDELGPKR